MTAIPALRASAASRWVNCPESAWLEAAHPEEEGDAAREGTAAHEMAELILTGTVDGPEELFDRSSTNGVIFVAEMADPVMMYVDHVRSHKIDYWVEESISIDADGVTITGTCDGAVFAFDQNNGTLRIVDFKYGHGVVDAFMNWQLIIYAFGIITKHELWHVVKHVILTIVQPRSHHHSGPIREWSFAMSDVLKLWQCLVDAAKAAQQTMNRQARTGPHCRHCRIPHCNAATSAMMNAIDVTEAVLPDTKTPQEIALLLDKLERASDMIKHSLSAVQTRAEAMIVRGQPIPGRSLEPGKGKTKWVDESAAIALGDAMGISLSDKKVVTPAEAKRRGISDAVIKTMTRVPSTAPRLVKTNAIAKANEVFNE